MPTYDYLCSECGHGFEYFQAMSDEPLGSCPECEGIVRRLVSGGTGLIFKGTGFYLTDYGKPKNAPDSKKTTKKTKPKTPSTKGKKND